MRKSSILNAVQFQEYNISYQVGTADLLAAMQGLPALEPFDESVISFLNSLSKLLLEDKEARDFSDVITLAFWMRKASMEGLKKRFFVEENGLCRMGRGIVFHIAPSNVPVNYMYSLVAGLICGNANVVRIPSKEFPQIAIINRAINKALEENSALKPYIALIRYGHDIAVNDSLSTIADVRVIWGGDGTIQELRKSQLKTRATEITFADRYSIAVIDSNAYMAIQEKADIARAFYNDTYLTDQNACTSPRIVIWMGDDVCKAKRMFWEELHKLVEKTYELQEVQAVNKLTSSYLLSVAKDNIKKEDNGDNLIIRMQVQDISEDLMEFKDNSGYFFEYECKDIMELFHLCNDIGCQTVSYIGDKRMLLPLIRKGVKGIDRIVPIGKTMDFDMIWDGYNLFERLTRMISLQ